MGSLKKSANKYDVRNLHDVISKVKECKENCENKIYPRSDLWSVKAGNIINCDVMKIRYMIQENSLSFIWRVVINTQSC